MLRLAVAALGLLASLSFPGTFGDHGHPQTSWGLLVLDPDVADTLAVVAVRTVSLGPIGFDFIDNVGKVNCDFWKRARVTRNMGKDMVTIKP
jgi:hypothetical protein